MRHGNMTLAWKLPAKTIKAWGSTLHLKEGCNLCRSDLLREIHRAQTTNHLIKGIKSPVALPSMKTNLLFCGTRIWGFWEMTKHKRPPKFNTPEPTMEILVDGQVKASINGNYKHGMIRDIIKANKKED